MLNGKVYLVGAGPGDPDLITVRGVACIRLADVLIYDRLVNRELLAYAPSYCEFITRGRHNDDQDEINRLMVQKAGEGKTVVRLKGGDPFLFGRGGEEAEFLAAAGIPFEVVPGVTSALAVPAYAGIPVTHRGLARSVGIVTGHEAKCNTGSMSRWEELGHTVDTLVILMGLENLPCIVERLLAAGKNADTPVAVISQGTLPEQETLVSTLDRVVGEVKSSGIQPPATIVVGAVVGLRDKTAWFAPETTWSRTSFSLRRPIAGRIDGVRREQRTLRGPR